MVTKGRGHMKKVILFFVCFAVCASYSFGVNFVPEPMKLSAPKIMQYKFDGSNMIIPLTVSGPGGSATLCVYTKDKGSSIGKVKNGHLGWHYVNSIDTSIYISQPLQISTGSNSIVWDGKDDDGKIVPSGEYTYYLWGYNNRDPKQYVSRYVTTIMHNLGKQVHTQEYDQAGKPLANPYMYFTQNGSGFKAKWVIGNDPADSALIETCSLTAPANYSFDRAIIPVPGDFTKFFVSGGLAPKEGKKIGVWKMKWVPNGVAELEYKWGDNGFAGWDRTYDAFSGPETDGSYLYTINNQYHSQISAEAELAIIDLEDGSYQKVIDIKDWWSSLDDLAANGQLNGGPNGMNARGKNIYLGSHASCLVQMVNPQAETIDDFIVWSNGNGDNVLDHNAAPDAAKKWVCNDYKVPPFTTSFQTDSNGFLAGAIYGLGEVSFGLIGPDGDGIGYFAFAGDTNSRKFYVNFVDYDSPFDGMYTDNQASKSLSDNPNGAELQPGFMYVAHDSFKGIIANGDAVADAAPAAFTVAQNTPNPFNPTTSISFTLAKAGKVTVEVFNSAGQKIDTIANGTMSAGSHTLNWNASKFSAGVYFYTVKAGNVSKTVKMTLLK